MLFEHDDDDRCGALDSSLNHSRFRRVVLASVQGRRVARQKTCSLRRMDLDAEKLASGESRNDLENLLILGKLFLWEIVFHESCYCDRICLCGKLVRNVS